MEERQEGKRARRGRPKMRLDGTFRGLLGDGWQEQANDKPFWRKMGDELAEHIRQKL